jgi:hypothetical protein
LVHGEKKSLEYKTRINKYTISTTIILYIFLGSHFLWKKLERYVSRYQRGNSRDRQYNGQKKLRFALLCYCIETGLALPWQNSTAL